MEQKEKGSFNKESKGITLIALVVTIIVLIILAGVSINLILGENGIITKATAAKVAAEIATMEETAGLIYFELTVDENGKTTQEDVTIEKIVSKLKEQKYDIEKVSTSGNDVTGISLSSNEITVSTNGTAEIEVELESNSEGSNYYAKIDGNYYLMTFNNGVSISKTPIEIEDSSTDIEGLVATSSKTNYATVESINGNKITIKGGASVGTSTITVIYGSYSKECTVAVGEKPTESSEPDETTSFSTAYGRIDVIWLSGTGKTFSETPNAPVLTANGESMKPVTFNSSTSSWNKVTSPETTTWYNYEKGEGTSDNTSSMWANAMTTNNSYFVWIPRYAYRITYYSSSTSTEPTGYYDGLGMWNATDGTVKYKLESGIETVDYNGEKYIVHPAFGTNLDLGGWSNSLSGFWVAKFEMSGTGTSLISTYGTESTRSQSIGAQYTSGRQGIYGYTGTKDTDGYTSFMNSHMMKNSEWGAVVYLTHSQYGRNGTEITINGTGLNRGGGTGTAYITNVAQSTTGNVYGIYDISGGAYEALASFDGLSTDTYMTDKDCGLYLTQSTLDGNGKYVSTKYATVYSNGTSTSDGTKIYTVGKTGDATKEVYTGSSCFNWFTDASIFACSSSPFFGRGGSHNSGPVAGVFTTTNYDGASSDKGSFRVVLCP